jgi:hypothetical protein
MWNPIETGVRRLSVVTAGGERIGSLRDVFTVETLLTAEHQGGTSCSMTS